MYLLRVGRKGVVVLPKALRDRMGVKEGDLLVVEEREGFFSVRAFKPLVVKVDLERVDELLDEERVLEESKFERMLKHE